MFEFVIAPCLMHPKLFSYHEQIKNVAGLFSFGVLADRIFVTLAWPMLPTWKGPWQGLKVPSEMSLAERRKAFEQVFVSLVYLLNE